jgi:anthranilate synthase
MHGKPSEVTVRGGRLLAGLPKEFTVGRYHSLYARRSTLPRDLMVSAETADRIVMAIEHASLPIAAVQFHPESVMTAADLGHHLIERTLTVLAGERALT